MTGVVVAVDVGLRYSGVAVSNPEGTLALPLEVIDERNPARRLARLASIVREREAREVIVGRPVSLRGSRIELTYVAEHFAATLQVATERPVRLVDERLSSVAAARTAGRGQRVDAAAAALFLQTYLDRRG